MLYEVITGELVRKFKKGVHDLPVVGYRALVPESVSEKADCREQSECAYGNVDIGRVDDTAKDEEIL